MWKLGLSRAAVKDLDGVFEKMHLAISISRNEALDSVLKDFMEVVNAII